MRYLICSNLAKKYMEMHINNFLFYKLTYFYITKFIFRYKGVTKILEAPVLSSLPNPGVLFIIMISLAK